MTLQVIEKMCHHGRWDDVANVLTFKKRHIQCDALAGVQTKSFTTIRRYTADESTSVYCLTLSQALEGDADNLVTLQNGGQRNNLIRCMVVLYFLPHSWQ